MLLFGCTQANTNSANNSVGSGTGLIGIKETSNTNTGVEQMNKNIVENSDTIQVDYILKLDSGEEKDSSDEPGRSFGGQPR